MGNLRCCAGHVHLEQKQHEIPDDVDNQKLAQIRLNHAEDATGRDTQALACFAHFHQRIMRQVANDLCMAAEGNEEGKNILKTQKKSKQTSAKK